MKKTSKFLIVFGVFVFVLLVTTAFIFIKNAIDGNYESPRNNGMKNNEVIDNNAVFFVYDKYVDETKININYDNKSVRIPLIAMCDAMGAKITWIGDAFVFIKFEETTYILNNKNESLKEIGSDIDLILYPPGGYECVRFYNSNDKEVFIDDVSLTRFVRSRGAFIKVDFESGVVSIIEEDRTGDGSVS